jgi:hypothetical protein
MGLFHDPGERLIGDIDLLVPHGRSGEAVEALIGMGYRVADEGEQDHHHHHPALVHAAWPAAVEIHKETVSHLYRRALPAEAVARRARTMTIAGRRIGVPCAEDLIVHNIVHSQLANRNFWSAEFSLRDAYDLVLLTRRFGNELNWARLGRRLDRDVGGGKVGFYVRQTHRLFGCGYRRRFRIQSAPTSPRCAGRCMQPAGFPGCSGLHGTLLTRLRPAGG